MPKRRYREFSRREDRPGPPSPPPTFYERRMYAGPTFKLYLPRAAWAITRPSTRSRMVGVLPAIALGFGTIPAPPGGLAYTLPATSMEDDALSGRMPGYEDMVDHRVHPPVPLPGARDPRLAWRAWDLMALGFFAGSQRRAATFLLAQEDLRSAAEEFAGGGRTVGWGDVFARTESEVERLEPLLLPPERIG